MRLYKLVVCSQMLLSFMGSHGSVIMADALDNSNVNYRYPDSPGYLRERQPTPGESPDQERQLIIGGEDAVTPSSVHPYPFFVEWEQGCGAVLIHSDILLTAAHCFHAEKETLATVYIGSAKRRTGVVRYITHLFPHPWYNATNLAYDFMLLKLNEPVVRSTQNPNIFTASINRDPAIPMDGDRLIIMGMGSTGPGVSRNETQLLQTATVNYFSQHKCDAMFTLSADLKPGETAVPQHIMFCAGNILGGVDSCAGDSGSPVVDLRGNLVGITSFGETECGEPLSPGLYSRVSAVTDWIDQTVCIFSSNPGSDCQEIMIQVTYDDYPAETSWYLTNDKYEPIVYNKKGTEAGIKTQKVKVPPGTYHLLVVDSESDGMCCEYGMGFVLVATGDQMHMIEGNFGSQASLEFQVLPPPTTGPDGSIVTVSTPAPTSATKTQKTSAPASSTSRSSTQMTYDPTLTVAKGTIIPKSVLANLDQEVLVHRMATKRSTVQHSKVVVPLENVGVDLCDTASSPSRTKTVTEKRTSFQASSGPRTQFNNVFCAMAVLLLGIFL